VLFSAIIEMVQAQFLLS